MPLPVLPGVVRCAASGAISGGGQWVNVWHIRNISLADWDPASLSALHTIFHQFYDGPSVGAGVSQSALWPAGTTGVKISYTPLDGSSGAYEFPLTASGGAAAAPPAEVACVLTLRTALRGRQNRGRIYLPGPALGNLNAVGHLTTAYVNGVLAQIAGVAAAIVTGGAEIGVGSYGPYKNPVTGVVSDNPATNGGSSPHFTPVTTWSMDDSCDVQRGRKT